jgi:8-oxo-dGTP pyrophosphatase MutT (NUDIX family)
MPKAKQVAVIPWRERGGLHVLLIRKRKGGRWGIPKGHIHDKAFDYHKAALEECHEEAGIEGRISRRFLGEFTYRRNGNRHHVRVLTLRVDQVLAEYPEMEIRERAWFTLGDAVKLVGRKAVRGLLAELPQCLGRRKAVGQG